jgi:chromosome segregation ATPase
MLRKRLRQKLDEATENTREKVTHLQSIEKTYEELKAELDDANHELSRSHAALHGLEKLQRTQVRDIIFAKLHKSLCRIKLSITGVVSIVLQHENWSYCARKTQL